MSWQAPLFATTPEIDAYVVQWKLEDDDEFDTTRQAIVTDLENLSHTVTGLPVDTSYTVRVAAVNEDDTTDFSDDDGWDRTATIVAASGDVPPRPMALSLSADHESIHVNWKTMWTPERYLVFWRTPDQEYDGTRSKEVWVGGRTYSTTLDGLTNGSTYSVKLVAVDELGWGQSEWVATEEQEIYLPTISSTSRRTTSCPTRRSTHGCRSLVRHSSQRLKVAKDLGGAAGNLTT